jgi:dihydrofolate reductase
MADKPKLALVAALSRNHMIGKDNKLLWDLPDDMAHFKKLTTSHAVIMGRKTYESLPPRFRPLPNRFNIVLSQSQQDSTYGESPFWVNSIQEAIDAAQNYAEIQKQDEYFVIGGSEIYAQFMPKADRLYLTHVEADYDGDAGFPISYLSLPWDTHEISKKGQNLDQPSFKIIQYDRKP